MPKAVAAARKALEIDPDLAEAHTALGFVQLFYHWNRREAERELLKAIELKPNNSSAFMYYGLLLLTQGRYEDGLSQLRKAQELEPTSAMVSSLIEWGLFIAGRYQETIHQAKHTLELEPRMSVSVSTIGIAHLYLGQRDAVLAALKKAMEMQANTVTVHLYAYGLAVSGREKEAEALLDRYIEQSKGKYICAYEIACAYEGLKDRVRALQWFSRGEAERCDCLVWAGVEPWMKEVAKDPRFKALMARAGLLR